MKVRLLATAQSELNAARSWYASRVKGLDRQFLDEVRFARRQIADHPNAWHPLGDGVRRIRLGRFPYQLVYVVDGAEIVVIAVAHLHRAPEDWTKRLPKK
jgi:toxin ParE2